MRKLLCAGVLSLLVSAVASAETTEPISTHLDVPFKPVYYLPYAPVFQKDPNYTKPIPLEKKVKPKAKALVKPKPTIKTRLIIKPVVNKRFRYDRNVSWYGPGFYGGKTACGQKYTKYILGVAHRTLPCGTLVTFSWKGRTLTVPVIDRGPYVTGRQWDLSGGLCVKLHHCFTGPIYYRIGK